MNSDTAGLHIFLSIAGFAILLTAGILVYGFSGSNSLAFWLFGAAAAWPSGQIAAHLIEYADTRKRRTAK